MIRANQSLAQTSSCIVSLCWLPNFRSTQLGDGVNFNVSRLLLSEYHDF